MYNIALSIINSEKHHSLTIDAKLSKLFSNSSSNKTIIAMILASILKIHGIKKYIAVQRFQRRNETHGQTTKHTHNTRNTKKVSKRKKTHHTQHNIQHKTKHNKIKNNETK